MCCIVLPASIYASGANKKICLYGQLIEKLKILCVTGGNLSALAHLPWTRCLLTNEVNVAVKTLRGKVAQ